MRFLRLPVDHDEKPIKTETKKVEPKPSRRKGKRMNYTRPTKQLIKESEE